MEFFKFLSEYWYLIITALAMVILAVCFIVDFIKKSPKERLESVKQWAVYACALAEAHLGSGTGQLKMKETYNMFLKTFPSLAEIISFEQYKAIAEESLAELKEMLKTNPNIQNIVQDQTIIQDINNKE